jgi:hypothetical protein
MGKPSDIHRQICEVYGENGTSDGMVRKLESSKKVVIMCMTSIGAAGRVSSQSATFYEEEM